MDDTVKFTCPCYDVTGRAFRELIRQGITDARKIQEMTGAGLGCGMCEDRMLMVIRDAVEAGKDRAKEREPGRVTASSPVLPLPGRSGA